MAFKALTMKITAEELAEMREMATSLGELATVIGARTIKSTAPPDSQLDAAEEWVKNRDYIDRHYESWLELPMLHGYHLIVSRGKVVEATKNRHEALRYAVEQCGWGNFIIREVTNEPERIR